MKFKKTKYKIIFCLFLFSVILGCGDSGSSVRGETNGGNNGKIRDSFFEVHLEPLNANEDMFNALSEFVDSAAQYNIKLTLLFTPQWVEMILSDTDKIDLLSQWRENGHEVGGHHHGPGVCPWDGYTNLDVNSQEFKNRQNNVPCPESVRGQEEYLGDMDDYISLLSELGQTRTITMSDADVDWPAGAFYSGGGRTLLKAISKPELVIYNGREVYKLSSAPLKPGETVLGELITVDDLKNEYLSEKEGKFGLNAHAADYKQNPDLYKEWFEFLNKQDPGMKNAGTISRICGDCLEKIELSKDNDFEIEDVTVNLKSRHGYNIRVRSVRPRFSKYPEKRFPIVLRIAGGWGVSTFLLNNRLTKKAASYGLIIAAFDTEPKLKEKPGSRVRDYNGFKDQDDAATVLASILNHPNVNPDMAGVWSHSNGITLASGVLGREKYKELSEKIIFLLDDEGPHCPMDILNLPLIEEIVAKPEVLERWRMVLEAKVGYEKDYNTVEEFFQERCAVYFIGGFKGIYQRIQADYDHALTYYHGHAVEMLNTATNEALWTRLNRRPKNQTYQSVLFPDSVDIDDVIDIKELEGPNDSRTWDVLFYLFDQ